MSLLQVVLEGEETSQQMHHRSRSKYYFTVLNKKNIHMLQKKYFRSWQRQPQHSSNVSVSILRLARVQLAHAGEYTCKPPGEWTRGHVE